MSAELDRREYGRRDSNSHGHLGPVRVTKVMIPAASKAAVYADFTTPALFAVTSITLLYGLGRANICAYLRRGFHAAFKWVHRAGVLQSLRPFYSTMAFINLSASAIPRLFREYLVPKIMLEKAAALSREDVHSTELRK